MPIFEFKNQTEWLRERKKDVTSTEVASLLGLSPYKSRFALWQEKAGFIEPDFEDNPFTIWGRRLQEPVALGVAEDMGWQCRDLSLFYLRHDSLPLGASLDHEILCPKRGRGLQEIKTTYFFSSDFGWLKEQAPVQYEAQHQTQLHLAACNGEKFDFGVISALDGRKEVRNYFRAYDKKFGELIELEVDKFFHSIKTGQPPEPDYIADEELLISLLPAPRAKEGKTLTGNPEAQKWAEIYLQAEEKIKPLREQISPFEKEKKEAKNRLLSMLGNAEFAIIGKLQITNKIQEVDDSFRFGGEKRRLSFKRLK